MIVAWSGLMVGLVLVVMAIPTSRWISVAIWPGEAPLNLHDNRARDPHLRHLARILGSDSTAQAQRTIAELSEGIVTSSRITLLEGEAAARQRLGPVVGSFVSEPAPQDHHKFLRHLGDALEQIERM